MKITALHCLLAIAVGGLSLAFATAGMAAGTGLLDPAFGSNGTATLFPGQDSDGSAIAVDGDQRILVAGGIDSAGTGLAFVARLLPDGTLDDTFGTGGAVTGTLVPEGPGDHTVPGSFWRTLYWVSPLESGRVLVLVGWPEHMGVNYNRERMSLVALTDTGVLDTAYGVDGIATLPYSETGLQPAGVTSSGSVTLVGSGGVVQVDPDGALVSGIGGEAPICPGFDEGVESTDSLRAAPLADGGSVVAISRGDTGEACVVRFNESGAVVGSFGGGAGRAVISTGSHMYLGYPAELADGSIMVPITSYEYTDNGAFPETDGYHDWKVGAVRMSATGDPVLGFGNAGLSLYPDDSRGEDARGILAGPDLTGVVHGTANDSHGQQRARVWRLSATGALLPIAGRPSAQPSSKMAAYEAMLPHGDGNLIAVGGLSIGSRTQAAVIRICGDIFGFESPEGSSEDDILVGSCVSDGYEGGGGDDRLYGLGGADALSGGAGNDRLAGDSGSDVLNGGPGRDRLRGGSGRDVIRSRDRTRDHIVCGSGYDTVYADRKDAVHQSCERVLRR